jgi:hypothetical protein
LPLFDDGLTPIGNRIRKKIVTTSLTIGSGGSGGVFGPSMTIGGCGGGALGTLFHQHWATLVCQPACFVMVGTAGCFAAAAKSPFTAFTALIIVSVMPLLSFDFNQFDFRRARSIRQMFSRTFDH